MIHFELYLNRFSTKYFLKSFSLLGICSVILFILIKATTEAYILAGFALIAIYIIGYAICIFFKRKAKQDIENNQISKIETTHFQLKSLPNGYAKGNSTCLKIKKLEDAGITIKTQERLVFVPVSPKQSLPIEPDIMLIEFDHYEYILNEQKKLCIEGYFTKQKIEKIEKFLKTLKNESYPLCLKYFTETKILYKICTESSINYPKHIITMITEINDMI